MTPGHRPRGKQHPSEPPGSIADLIAQIAAARPLRDSLVYQSHQEGAPAIGADLPEIPSCHSINMRGLLAAARIDALYSHQAEALREHAAGRHVLTVTPTASGKSLIYTLPTLEALAGDPQARALYLFPYKALEQDQLSALQAHLRAAGLEDRVTAAIYDGDTPDRERRRLRAHAPGVLITNPDMLHMGLLPYHDEWRELFDNLKIVVVDELHVYRGIFGSHFHHVMRRLARVCRRHGSKPRFIASSATIGNPREFVSSLLGEPFSVIERSGAPRSGQHFLFVNPGEGSPYTAAAWLIEKCVRSGYRTIAFTKARKIAELLGS